MNSGEPAGKRPLNLVQTDQEERWLRENRDALASINRFIERHGLLADRLRIAPRSSERCRT